MEWMSGNGWGGEIDSADDRGRHRVDTKTESACRWYFVSSRRGMSMEEVMW